MFFIFMFFSFILLWFEQKLRPCGRFFWAEMEHKNTGGGGAAAVWAGTRGYSETPFPGIWLSSLIPPQCAYEPLVANENSEHENAGRRL